MKTTNPVSQKYAKALFECVKTSPQIKPQQVLEQFRVLHEALRSPTEILTALTTPMITGDEKKQILEKALANQPIQEDLKAMLFIIAQKNRFEYFEDILKAFEQQVDHSLGLIRGMVRAVSAVGPEQRKNLQQKISQATNKNVVLDYKEDLNLIGGLVAEVDSYKFDDSLETQIRLLKEEIKRRGH